MTENVTAPAPTVLADEALEFVLSAFAASLRVAFGLPPAPPGAAAGGGDATVLDVGARGPRARARCSAHRTRAWR